MNAIIAKIILFDNAGEKREVELYPGLNIITGDSKTGKSALIEIVDYCLFASRSTIPKGIINDFANYFVIILKISEKYLSIARPNAKTGNGNNIYLRIETDEAFLSDIRLEYFTAVQYKNLKDAQEEVERHLGLSVKDTRTDDEDDKRNAGKVTLRSMVSFLFQHQNLIANKHSLFYRFDDFNKRKKTIADFPVLIGWESNEYFLLYRELEQKKRELKVEEKLISKLKIKDDELTEKIRDLIFSYYKFIGMELEDNLSLNELKKISKNLPNPSVNSYSDANIKIQIESKKQNRFQLQTELSEKELLINELTGNNKVSLNYGNRLKAIEITLDDVEKQENITCPVCKNNVPEVLGSVNSLFESKNMLIEELSKVGTYKIDSTEQIELLQSERDKLKRQIGKLTTEIKRLEDQDEAFKKSKSLAEQAFILKGATDSNINQILQQNNIVRGGTDLEELKGRINWLQEKIEGYDVKTKIKEAESFLANRMTEICDKLDFEKELKPGRLQFSLEDFTFYYHFNEKEKIYLSEMGSGANWLACHLSIFLALLHLNSKSLNSAIPSLLIIDQPSQVYFPREYKVLEEDEKDNIDENIKQVKNIFTVLNEEIETIKKDCGFEPQIIVMDHADESDFSDFVRKRWKKDGDKLI
jgi:uncharacterized small protein (DUF1192 family)